MPQRIVRVHPGSLAARSGIREGETLVSINRTPVLDLVDVYKRQRSRMTCSAYGIIEMCITSSIGR